MRFKVSPYVMNTEVKRSQVRPTKWKVEMQTNANDVKAGRTLELYIKGRTKTVTVFNVTKRLKNHQ